MTPTGHGFHVHSDWSSKEFDALKVGDVFSHHDGKRYVVTHTEKEREDSNWNLWIEVEEFYLDSMLPEELR